MRTRAESAAPSWPLQARTPDGRAYVIRPVRPDDLERERDFILRMSPESRYRRFLHEMREPSEKLLHSLVNVDRHRTMALLATVVAEQESIVGVARYAADPDGRNCEFAVAVDDGWQCRGVGSTLMNLLFEHAARQGFDTIYGTIMADNHGMIELAQWLGLTVDAPSAGCETVRAWRRLN